MKVGLLTALLELKHGEFAKEQDVLLLPDGDTKCRDGDVVRLEATGAAVAVAAFQKHGVDLPFDINHSTVLKVRKGEPAPAYGWANRIWYEPGRGLLAHVTWTDEGYAMIKSGQYRYLSPVFGYEPQSGRVREIHSVALTTKPAVPQMPALAATDLFNGKEHSMDGLLKMLQEGGEAVASADLLVGELKAKLQAKGVELSDGSDLTAILKAAIAYVSNEGAASAEKEVAASVRAKLQLAEDADAGMVLKALADLQAHIGYTANDQVKALTLRVGELETEEKKRRGAELREKYRMKLNPNDAAQWKWALETSETDPEHFEMLVRSAPDALPPQGKTTTPPAKDRRETVIKAATEEFQANPRQAITSLAGYVDGALDEESLTRLNPEERAALETAV